MDNRYRKFSVYLEFTANYIDNEGLWRRFGADRLKDAKFKTLKEAKDFASTMTATLDDVKAAALLLGSGICWDEVAIWRPCTENDCVGTWDVHAVVRYEDRDGWEVEVSRCVAKIDYAIDYGIGGSSND